MHTQPAAGERHRLSLLITVAGYAAAWMIAVPVMANLAQSGLIARHHLEVHPNYHLRYPPYTGEYLPPAARPITGARATPA